MNAAGGVRLNGNAMICRRRRGGTVIATPGGGATGFRAFSGRCRGRTGCSTKRSSRPPTLFFGPKPRDSKSVVRGHSVLCHYPRPGITGSGVHDLLSGILGATPTNELILTRRPSCAMRERPVHQGHRWHSTSSPRWRMRWRRLHAPARTSATRVAWPRGANQRTVVGVMILTPAMLDALRTIFPSCTWLRWASRAAKVADALVVIRAAH